jgi:hypothetical protein
VEAGFDRAFWDSEPRRDIGDRSALVVGGADYGALLDRQAGKCIGDQPSVEYHAGRIPGAFLWWIHSLLMP